MSTIISRIAAMVDSTGLYNLVQLLEVTLEKEIDNFESLNDSYSRLLTQNRHLDESLTEAIERIDADAAKISGLEERVASLEMEVDSLHEHKDWLRSLLDRVAVLRRKDISHSHQYDMMVWEMEQEAGLHGDDELPF
jgi:chromosome segregation ATPase